MRGEREKTPDVDTVLVEDTDLFFNLLTLADDLGVGFNHLAQNFINAALLVREIHAAEKESVVKRTSDGLTEIDPYELLVQAITKPIIDNKIKYRKDYQLGPLTFSPPIYLHKGAKIISQANSLGSQNHLQELSLELGVGVDSVIGGMLHWGYEQAREELGGVSSLMIKRDETNNIILTLIPITK